jgi:hypothetical protein
VANGEDVLAVIEAVSENAHRKSVCFRNGLLARGAIAENARQIGHFSNPAPIVFLFDIDCEFTRCTDSRPSLLALSA